MVVREYEWEICAAVVVQLIGIDLHMRNDCDYSDRIQYTAMGVDCNDETVEIDARKVVEQIGMDFG